MANENNKINELVPDVEDPTVELETPTFRQDQPVDGQLEADAKTYDAPNAARSNSNNQSNSRLQYDIEQLHAKWLGLEAEIRAREEQTCQLNLELIGLQGKIARKEKLLKKRDSNIKLLKSEIRQRDDEYRSLYSQFSDMRNSLVDIPSSPTEKPATDHVDDSSQTATDYTSDELYEKLVRNEKYTDSIRQQLQDMIAASFKFQSDRDHLTLSLRMTKNRNDDFARQLDSKIAAIEKLQHQIAAIEDQHTEEMRLLRFELGEAQDTVIQTEDLNSKLASDLVDTSHFKDELERMLGDAEKQAESRAARLQKRVNELSRTVDSNEQKLGTKNEAITALLSELAKKTAQIESIGEVENVIQDLDDRMSEQFEMNTDTAGVRRAESTGRRVASRITRVLIGNIGDQVLRFPLFKDKLTIGRTEDNDIQLNAAFVSRRHAVIQTDGDTTRVIDWGSKNGVYVNARRIKEHFLANGDIVTIGDARFRYEERKKHDS